MSSREDRMAASLDFSDWCPGGDYVQNRSTAIMPRPSIINCCNLLLLSRISIWTELRPLSKRRSRVALPRCPSAQRRANSWRY